MAGYFLFENKKYQFDGFDGDLLKHTHIDNGTLFFTKAKKYMFHFIALGESIIDKYHIEFMKKVIQGVQQQIEKRVKDIILDIDEILSTIPEYRKAFTINFYESNIRIENITSSLYNLGVLYEFSLIPVDNLTTDEKHSVFMYGDREILRVATDIERFPSFVSYNVIQRDIDKLLEQHLLDYKVIDLQRILKKGLYVVGNFGI